MNKNTSCFNPRIFSKYTGRPGGNGIKNQQINEIGILRQFERDKNCQKGSGLGFAIAFKISDMYKIKKSEFKI
jgi:hypothetical protein